MTKERVKRRPVDESAVLSRWKKYHLLSGHDFFGDGYGRDNLNDPERLDEMRQGWEDFRDELLPEWIAHFPRSRPYAWWVFDAPERRQRIDGKPHPFDNPERNAIIESNREKYPSSPMDACRLSFGRPTIYLCGDDGVAQYETESAYLERLGLLFPGEADAVPLPRGRYPFPESE